MHLASKRPDADDEVNLERCIECQDAEHEKLTSTTNGRNNIKDAAAIRNDLVTKRLRLIQDDETFLYHMTNECCKKYIMPKTLEKVAESSGTSEQAEDDGSLYSYRRLSTPRS